MSTRDIIVMGASSGGVEALRKIVRELPADFPASVFVVLHIAADSASMLPEILTRGGRLPARHPEDGEEFEPGTIYVAPTDRHMRITRGAIRLDKGPCENGHRPAIDPLFTSAATSSGPRVIGVILSGSGDDGTAGLRFVKDRGGLAVVQEPADSMFPNMPGAALLAVAVDACAAAEEIPRILVDMVRSPAPPEKNLLHYRCHVGRVFSSNRPSSGRKAVLEEALWSAVRMFQERVVLSDRIVEDAESRGLHAVARGFREKVRKARISAKLIEELLLEHGEGSQGTGRAEEDDAESARSRAPGRAHAGRSSGREDIP